MSTVCTAYMYALLRGWPAERYGRERSQRKGATCLPTFRQRVTGRLAADGRKSESEACVHAWRRTTSSAISRALMTS